MNNIKKHNQLTLFILLCLSFCLATNCGTFGKQTDPKHNHPQVFKHKDISGKVFWIEEYRNETDKKSIYITHKGDSIFVNNKLLTPPTFLEDGEKTDQFIENNLEYPLEQNNCQGRVILVLLIDGKGILQDTHIIKDIAGCPQYNDAALKFVTTHMTKWKPAISVDRINIASTYILPIHFK